MTSNFHFAVLCDYLLLGPISVFSHFSFFPGSFSTQLYILKLIYFLHPCSYFLSLSILYSRRLWSILTSFPSHMVPQQSLFTYTVSSSLPHVHNHCFKALPIISVYFLNCEHAFTRSQTSAWFPSLFNTGGME